MIDYWRRTASKFSHRIACGWLLIFASFPVIAAHVSVELDGVSGQLRDAVMASLALNQYANRDVTAAQAKRHYDQAADNVSAALKPYGYYNASVSSNLKQVGDDYTAVLHVNTGDPVKVTTLDIRLDGDASDQPEVRKAVDGFLPAKGQVLDQPLYEKSKAVIQSALSGSGYLDAQLVTHRIEVTRSTKSADIHLAWKVGQRYHLGKTTFSGGQFPEAFMHRYIPWHKGDFYSQNELLAFQQRLIDADYFSLAQVAPDVKDAHDGIIPIKVLLAPAKRTIYTAGLFTGTDTGPGVRGGISRRWINKHGHKIKYDALVAQRLKTLSALYQIPLPGRDEHSFNFGATYRDENTETSTSRTFRLVANDSQRWHGWARIIGVQFLTGDFQVADIKGHTKLLYPEISLARKYADNFNFPRRGYSLTFVVRAGQKGFVSDTSFAQITANAKWIHGVTENSRFIARGTLGATHVGDFDKLPPELRFFAGGDRSIRGYGYQTIGPRNEEGKVIGGEDIAVVSASYEYYFSPHWGVASFVDTGDAFTGNNFRLKIGSGFGLRWRSPVGLIRLDLGFPVHDSSHSGVKLHLIIGPDL